MKGIVALAAVFAAASINATAQELDIAAVCYHSVTDNPLTLSEYRISGEEFRADLEYFTSRGYTFMKPCELWYAQPGKNMALTFDDGYDDFYEVVFPLLKEYNAKAAVYIIASEIDKTGYLKSWQIKELDESGLVEIGNHTTIVHNYGWTRDDYTSDLLKVNEFMEDVKDCSSRIYNMEYSLGNRSFILEKMISADPLAFIALPIEKAPVRKTRVVISIDLRSLGDNSFTANMATVAPKVITVALIPWRPLVTQRRTVTMIIVKAILSCFFRRTFSGCIMRCTFFCSPSSFRNTREKRPNIRAPYITTGTAMFFIHCSSFIVRPAKAREDVFNIRSALTQSMFTRA